MLTSDNYEASTLLGTPTNSVSKVSAGAPFCQPCCIPDCNPAFIPGQSATLEDQAFPKSQDNKRSIQETMVASSSSKSSIRIPPRIAAGHSLRALLGRV